MTSFQIRHHLSQDLLMAYSAGSLPEAYGLVVATHISLCDQCRAELESFEALGGSLLETGKPAELSPGSLSQTLARIAANDRGAPQLTSPKPTSEAGDPLPEPLASYAGGTWDAIQWRSVGMGVKQAILPTACNSTARLLYIPAGRAMPDHSHGGTELTLVLQGAFLDETGRYARGDIEVADEHTEHTPVAAPGEPCICLAATDAPLKFNSLIPRMLQRFLQI